MCVMNDDTITLMPYANPRSESARAKSREASRRHYAKRRDAKNAAKRQALIERSPDPATAAYAAGLFDGEGTATIISGRPGYSRCVVALTSTDKAMVDWLNERWPGSVTHYKARKATHNDHWTWRLGGDATLPFLFDIHPYLITKAEVARLVALCQMSRWEGQRTPGYPERIEHFHQQVRELNRRGRGPEGSSAADR